MVATTNGPCSSMIAYLSTFSTPFEIIYFKSGDFAPVEVANVSPDWCYLMGPGPSVHFQSCSESVESIVQRARDDHLLFRISPLNRKGGWRVFDTLNTPKCQSDNGCKCVSVMFYRSSDFSGSSNPVLLSVAAISSRKHRFPSDQS